MAEPESNILLTGLFPPQDAVKFNQIKYVVKDLQELYNNIDSLQRLLVDSIDAVTFKISIYPNNSGNPNIGTLVQDPLTPNVFSLGGKNYIDGKIVVIQNATVKSEGDGFIQSGQVTGTPYYNSITFTNYDPTDTFMVVYI